MIKKIKKMMDQAMQNENVTEKQDINAPINENTAQIEQEPLAVEPNEHSTPPEQEANKVAELNDRLLRLHAEFENYKRRTTKDRIELIKSANADIFSALLPVLDDFDRALKSLETSSDIDSLKEGQKLIHQKLKNLLMAKGLEEMDVLGKDFDSDWHEAITNVPGDDNQKGKIVDQIEKGYLLNGKVIRYAKVIVGA